VTKEKRPSRPPLLDQFLFLKDFDVVGALQRAIDQQFELFFVQLHLLADEVWNLPIIKAMAQRMEQHFAKRMQARAARATTLPADLLKLDERLAKLRTMAGLDDDERQLLIDKTEAKRKELVAKQPAALQQAKILTMLPKAAAAYLKLIEEGLAGDARSAARVRTILKDMLGPVSLSPGDYGSLWAAYFDNPWALVKDAIPAGTDGRGDRI
jgi:hypothetical protein